MRFSDIRKLPCASMALLSTVAALDLLSPGHAVAELLAAPNNLTIMSPRARKSGFEQQFASGSAQTGFSELKRVFERQACGSGFGSCRNDAGTCCPLGGRCCGGGKCCDVGQWCYSYGCCLNTEDGCDNAGCCDIGQNCCRGGSCCESGYDCVISNGQLGCCPIGRSCTSNPCVNAGYLPCRGENFCCPSSNICYRDNAGQPACRDPSYTSASPTPPSTATTTPTSRATETVVIVKSTGPSTNVGAIAGGTVAGIIGIALLIFVIVMWRRQKAKNNAAASAEPGSDDRPAYTQPAHNPQSAPPTPVTGDPFLTPMAQAHSLGAAYFAPGPASPKPSGTGSGTGTQYTGLPEPQHAHYSTEGAIAEATAIPSSRRDGAQPHLLATSFTPTQGGADNSTRGSGYADSVPSPGPNTTGYAGYPEVDGDNSQSRGSTPAPHPGRASSTMTQPLPHNDRHDQVSLPQSPPSARAYDEAPPSTGGSNLLNGAAPPVTNFSPDER